MYDVWIDGVHVNKDGPVMIKGKPIYPMCHAKTCKELEEKGEAQLIKEQEERCEQMFASRAA